MFQRFRDSLLDGLGQRQSDGVPLALNDNESVPLDREHVSAVKPRGLVFDGVFRGEAKTWSELYLRLLETLAKVDGDKFEELPDVDPKTFILKGSRVIFERKGKGRHLKKGCDNLGPRKDVRAELEVGTKMAFTPPGGLVFRLIDYFGLNPEQFRIWTGPGEATSQER
jgi:hypothetical protein